jgi:hypothetical protein
MPLMLPVLAVILTLNVVEEEGSQRIQITQTTTSIRKKNHPAPTPHIFNTQKDIHPTQPFLLPAPQT